MFFWYLHIIFQWITDSYMFILFLRMISDWYIMLVRRRPGSIFATVTQAVYALTEPPLRWLRQYIKPIPAGAVQIDLSFMVLWFALIVLEKIF